MDDIKIKIRTDLILIGLVLSFLIISEYFKIGWFCPFFDGLGIPCPGCGFLSACKALLRLDFSKAYYHHPAVFIFPIYLIIYIYHTTINKLNKKFINLLIYSFIVIMLVIYLLRINGWIPGSAKLILNEDSIIKRIFFK
ncbi:MAG: DUF2752 domain-containing protein [Bacilli bacterium]|nr:DUF2752 domain-containing protein [Bacilli bacterium]